VITNTVNRTTARPWYGNSGIPEPPPEEEVELEGAEEADVEPVVAELMVVEPVEADVADELAEALEEADVSVEVLVVVEDRAESGTTEIEELPLLATKSSPF